MKLFHSAYVNRAAKRRVGRVQQVVGCVAHRAKDDDGLFVFVGLDYRSYMLDSFGVGDRRAAKFHYYHSILL